MGISTVKISNPDAPTKTLDVYAPIWRVDVIHELNRIPYAELVLIDGDLAEQKFEWSTHKMFKPGNPIQIEIADSPDGPFTKIFKGFVVRQNIQSGSRKGGLLTLELAHAALALTKGRNTRVFHELTDDKVIANLLDTLAGKKVTTKVKHPEIVQYNATDWDFICSRAEANSLHLKCGVDGVDMLPAKGISKTHMIDYAKIPVYNWEVEANMREQIKQVQALMYAGAKLTLDKAVKAKPPGLIKGSINSTKAASNIGLLEDTLLAPVALEPKELQEWANAEALKKELSLISGRFSMAGNAAIEPGHIAQLKGISTMFNIKLLITGVRHLKDQEGWRTEIQVGHNHRWQYHLDEYQAPDASGLLPGISGLHVGTVMGIKKKDKKDPDFRIRVKVPAYSQQSGKTGKKAAPDNSIWARMSSLYAGADYGSYIQPEVGDEVVLGFLNNDPRKAVVLGSLFSAKRKPFLPIDEKNVTKSIVMKNGAGFVFTDDKDKNIIEISSKHDKKASGTKQKLVFDQKKKSISILDKTNKNEVHVDDKGITLKTNKSKVIVNDKSVEITSGKDLKIDVKGNLTINASGSIKVSGSSVDFS